MRQIWVPSTVAAITLAAGIAAAQTPPLPAPGGAFESLSPGNRKIALAIFDSELRADPTGATKPLSLDEIAAMKQGGKGWGKVFKEMKSQNLVQDRNLGQAVSRMSRGGGATSAPIEITTASGRTVMVGRHGRSDAALSGRREFGSDDAGADAKASAAVGHGRDGGGATAAGGGAPAARGGAGSHGGGRGK